MPDNTIVLYGHPRSGNVYKPALMLALTDTAFQFKLVDLPGGEQRGDEFKSLNPFAKVPVLTDGDLVIRQSNSILLHLAAKTGKFGSSGLEHRIKISEWLFWEQDLMFTGVGRTRFLSKAMKVDPIITDFLRTLGTSAIATLDATLADSPWLCGDAPTIADISIYCYARLAEQADIDLGQRPHLLAWRERMEALPGWALPETILPLD